jgi:hypothetical protein
MEVQLIFKKPIIKIQIIPEISRNQPEPKDWIIIWLEIYISRFKFSIK